MNVFTPAETAANYAAAGVLKTRQPFLKLLILGIAAGALIGFPVCVTNMATYAITNASAVRIIAGVLFAFGLGIVVLTGAELFTGNTLLVISLLDRRVTWCAHAPQLGRCVSGQLFGCADPELDLRPLWLAGRGRRCAGCLYHAAGGREDDHALRQGLLHGCAVQHSRHGRRAGEPVRKGCRRPYSGRVGASDVLCGGRLQPLHRRHDLLRAGPVRQVRTGLRRRGHRPPVRTSPP